MRADDILAVKYSEDLAQFAEVRAVRRQPMTLRELVGLVLATTGKQPARVRELLRGGTCTYNIYRYWWDGIELEDTALGSLLASFPDPDPSRAFAAEHCRWVKFLDALEPMPRQVVVERAEAERRRWFRRQSFWDFLLSFAQDRTPGYLDYSYYHRADLFGLCLDSADLARLRNACERLATRELPRRLARGFGTESNWVRLELACPRS